MYCRKIGVIQVVLRKFRRSGQALQSTVSAGIGMHDAALY